MTLNINNYIIADSNVCHGQLTFKGTRVMVWLVLEMLAAGESTEEILKDYPSLTKNHIKAALNYAARAAERGRLEVSAKN